MRGGAAVRDSAVRWYTSRMNKPAPEPAPTTTWSSLEPYTQLLRALLPRMSSLSVFDARGHMHWSSEMTVPPEVSTQVVESVKQAALTVGKLQSYSHFGGEYNRDSSGRIQPRALDFEKPIPDYGYFLGLMREIGYDGHFGYELCHPFVNENHELMGIEQVHEQVKLAREYLSGLIKAFAK